MTAEHDRYPELDPSERDLAERVHGARPVPAAGFRGTLGRHLLENDPGYGTRPDRLRAYVAGLAGSGAVILALGTLHAVGAF